MNGNVLTFDTMREATRYIREMSEAATANIGGDEVWQHDSGVVLVGATAEAIAEDEGAESANRWWLLGTVAQVLY